GASLNGCQLVCCTNGMDVVEICAVSHDLLKLSKRVTALRPPILVRRQVSGNHVWTWVAVRPGWSPHWAEVRASSEVNGRVGFLRLAKVGGPAGGGMGVWGPAGGVAAVAVRLSVDNEAAQSHQGRIPSRQIQWDW